MDKLFENWREYGKSILKEEGPRSSEAGSVNKKEIEAFLGVMQELKDILVAEDSIEKYRSLSEKWNEISDAGPVTITLKFAKISEYISDQIEHESEMPVAADEEEEEGLPWDESETASVPLGSGATEEGEGAEAGGAPEGVDPFGEKWREEMRNKIKQARARKPDEEEEK
tara:strand:+ start:2770 stop:3279 length:510 start_codon:yes stop_codon:yes gene_type:complete